MVFNGEKFIREAVESILGQTYTDFEFVIVDDGSTDKTPKILKEFEQRDPRIRIITQANAGATKARNCSMRHARGELVALLDGDDFAASDRLKKQAEFLDKNPDVGLVGSGFHLVDETGRPLWTREVPPDHETLVKLLGKNNPITPSTAMIRRKVLEEVGLQDETIRYCPDHDHWVRVAMAWRIACVAEPLLTRRVHDGTMMSANPRARLASAVRVRQRAIRTLKLPWRYHFSYIPVMVVARLPKWFAIRLVNAHWRIRALRVSGGEYAPKP
jgi:glycosyltransferase involved in cell wall biosynthesis